MIHLALSMSAVGALRQALPKEAAIYGLANRMQVGPLDTIRAVERMELLSRIDATFPVTDMHAATAAEAQNAVFWENAVSGQRRIVWYSSCSAPDICALAVIIRDSPGLAGLNIIDVAGQSDAPPVVSAGELTPEGLQVLAGREAPVQPSLAQHLLRSLRLSDMSPDCPLRWWVAPDTVAPVGWGPVDSTLMSTFRDHAELPAARLVGEVLGALAHQVDDGVVWFRLHALLVAGLLASADPVKALHFNTRITPTV